MKPRPAALLLGLASHELRGPAGIVRGYLRLLQADSALSARSRNAVAEADRAADHLAGMLEEMNEYTQYLRGKQELHRRKCSLRSIINQATQMVQPREEPAILLDVIAPADVQANVDEARLRTGLVSIIEAVCRAQPTATTVDVTLEETGEGRRRVAVIDVAARSLGRGRRRSRPTDFLRSGLGLSLLVADAVMRAHGGRLVERWVSGRWAGYRIAGLR
jgi:signal transduction histidine kinase